MRRFTLRLVLLLSAMMLSLTALAQQDVITTAVGGGPNDIPALDSNLYNPVSVAVDSSGNYYIAATYQNRVFKVNTSGTLTVVAGSGAQGFGGDGVTGGAATADLFHPTGIALDSSGNLYIADQGNYVVRKVDSTNTITTIAGIAGSAGFSGDGGKGTSAQLYNPSGVAADTFGNLFIADTNNCRVRKLVLSSDTITTYAGNGTCGYSGDGSLATGAEIYNPYGVATDSSGNLFIADTYNFVIREVTKSSLKISTVCGKNINGFSGDGAAATAAEIGYVYQLAVSGTTVTIGDNTNYRVRQFTVAGNINTVAGTGTASFCGDAGKATLACFNQPTGVAVSGSNVYVADQYNYRIRLFTVGGNINTVAGNGTYNIPTLLSGEAPQGVVFNYPYGVYGDPSGNVFVNDTSNALVRELVKSTDLVNFFAGTGTYGYTGDGGKATSAEISYNYGVARDSSGNIYIADSYNHIIRMVNSAGTISTFAGVPQRAGYTGDGGKATSAELYYPSGVFVDSKNNVYIADTYNQVIREVTSGTINTIAGIGQRQGYSGDGGPANAAQLNYPYGVTVDGSGNVYIADTSNCRIREITALTGVINTVAGTGSCNFTGDGPATQEAVNSPDGVRVDANGNLFIADTNNQCLRWVDTAGLMTTFAGICGQAGYFGDAGAALSAKLYYPSGISVDSSGNFLVADQYNFRVRGITAFAALNTSVGSANFPLTSVGSTSAPETVILSSVGPLTIANISVTGPFSEIDDCPASLPNGTVCTMYIYFAPTASGNAAGTITVNTNGFFSAVSTISLTGLGTAISVTGAPLNFANQLVKTTSAAQTVTVKNTGTAAITMNGITLNETADFAISANTCPATGSKLNGGASCTISVTFTPGSTGLKKGSVIINDTDPTTPQLVGVSGTGISNVTLSPTSVTFATTAVGLTSGTTKVTLTNNTGVSITLSNPAVTVTGPFASASSTTCTNSLVLAKLATCFVNVDFKPTVVGFASGTLSIADTDVTSPQTAALQGVGTGIKFSTTSINFGTVTRGQTVSDTVTVYNVGTTTVTFKGAEIQGTNSADFGSTSGNPPCNGSLLAGANCTFSLTFDPSIVGSESATYKLFDNSPGSPQTIAVKGTGQ
jgi:sugar lactone lactonase YvrE